MERKPQSSRKVTSGKNQTVFATPVRVAVDLNEFPEIVRLHEVFRVSERNKQVTGEQENFARLVEALWSRTVFPDRIKDHRAHPEHSDEYEYLCSWQLESISEDPLEGWFSHAVLEENCPETLARYIGKLHVPATESNSYEVWMDDGVPYGVLSYSKPQIPTP